MTDANRGEFETTQWSLVVAAAHSEDSRSQAALNHLCEQYWAPIYFYVRRRVSDAHDAQDATQEFFVHLLEGDRLRVADKNRGRFRAFLLTSVRNFLINRHQHKTAAKRGGNRVLKSLDFDVGESDYASRSRLDESPEAAFQRKWAVTLLARVVAILGEESSKQDRAAQFERLKPFLAHMGDASSYAAAAQDLGMEPGAIRVAVHRMRRRLGELLRAEVQSTLENEEDIDAELDELYLSLKTSSSDP